MDELLSPEESLMARRLFSGGEPEGQEVIFGWHHLRCEYLSAAAFKLPGQEVISLP